MISTLTDSVNINLKFKSIVVYTLKNKIIFEYIKDHYESRNFKISVINMFFNSINSFLFSISAYYVEYETIIRNICMVITFICTIFSFLIKMLDYGKYIGIYKTYIDACNELICQYINYTTAFKNDDEKVDIKNQILSSYSNIIKLNSNINHIKIDLDEHVINELMHDFDDLLQISYHSVKKNIKEYKRRSVMNKNVFHIKQIESQIIKKQSDNILQIDSLKISNN